MTQTISPNQPINTNHQPNEPQHKKTPQSLFAAALVKPALKETFAKLNPKVQWRNPVMFVVYAGSILTTLLTIQALISPNIAQSLALI